MQEKTGKISLGKTKILSKPVQKNKAHEDWEN